MNILSDRIEFSVSSGEGVKVPYARIERVYVVDEPTGRPFLKTTVIGLSVLAVGILAAPAFSILDAKKHRYFLTVDFKDDVNVPHTMSFRMRGESSLKAKASIDAQIDKYKRSIAEQHPTLEAIPAPAKTPGPTVGNGTSLPGDNPSQKDSQQSQTSTPEYLKKYL